jgi:hypothetical protein
MTTRVHIVNLGPDPVDVTKQNPSEEIFPVATLYPGESVNEYVHDTQDLTVKEKK